MKELNIKLLLPYNWGHLRKIKVYDDKGILLTKIMHGEELSISIDPAIKKVIIKLDIFKSTILISQQDKVFLALFMNFRDRFPYKYIDTLRRECLTGKFLTETEFENFGLSFYTKSFKWVHKTEIDKHSQLLGFIIAGALTIFSVIEQNNPYQDLIFFIGMGSFFSLLMIHLENNKILLYDYKSRMIATGLAFILGSFFIQSSFPTNILFLIFSITFFLHSLNSIMYLQHKLKLKKE